MFKMTIQCFQTCNRAEEREELLPPCERKRAC